MSLLALALVVAASTTTYAIIEWLDRQIGGDGGHQMLLLLGRTEVIDPVVPTPAKGVAVTLGLFVGNVAWHAALLLCLGARHQASPWAFAVHLVLSAVIMLSSTVLLFLGSDGVSSSLFVYAAATLLLGTLVMSYREPISFRHTRRLEVAVAPSTAAALQHGARLSYELMTLLVYGTYVVLLYAPLSIFTPYIGEYSVLAMFYVLVLLQDTMWLTYGIFFGLGAAGSEFPRFVQCVGAGCCLVMGILQFELTPANPWTLYLQGFDVPAVCIVCTLHFLGKLPPATDWQARPCSFILTRAVHGVLAVMTLYGGAVMTFNPEDYNALSVYMLGTSGAFLVSIRIACSHSWSGTKTFVSMSRSA